MRDFRLLLLLTVLGCNGAGSRQHATATPTCAPDDGPAVRLEIGLASAACDAEATLPHLLVFLWDGTTPGAGDEYALDAVSTYATYEDEDGERDVDGGWIRFERFGTSRGISGSYHLELQADDVEGSFEGVYCDAEPLCG